MIATLTRNEWKTVYRALDKARSPSPLKDSIAKAGKATTDDSFNVEGSYYDLAEVVSLLSFSRAGFAINEQLAREIAFLIANELWSEVQSLNPKEQDAIRQQEHGSDLPEQSEGKGDAS